MKAWSARSVVVQGKESADEAHKFGISGAANRKAMSANLCAIGYANARSALIQNGAVMDVDEPFSRAFF